jgi:hypothetical protein
MYSGGAHAPTAFRSSDDDSAVATCAGISQAARRPAQRELGNLERRLGARSTTRTNLIFTVDAADRSGHRGYRCSAG